MQSCFSKMSFGMYDCAHFFTLLIAARFRFSFKSFSADGSVNGPGAMMMISYHERTNEREFCGQVYYLCVCAPFLSLSPLQEYLGICVNLSDEYVPETSLFLIRKHEKKKKKTKRERERKRRTNETSSTSRMSFVGRLANYVLNEFLVNALANSKSFQRFAVRTDDAMRKGNVYKTVSEGASKAKESVERYAEEAKEVAEKLAKEAAAKKPPPNS